MTDDVPTIFCDGLFQDEVVAITGGGTGIGLAIACETARLGARLAIGGRRPEPLAEGAEKIAAVGSGEVHTGTCDIRNPDEIHAWVDGILERYGRIDVLINNAGGQFPSPAESISPKGFEAVVRNNLLGTWNVTHAVATRAFVPQKRGRIVNIIAQVHRGFPGMVHTGAARAGVANMTMTLAIEWAMHGVRVNSVAPGIIASSGTKRYPPELLEAGKKASLAKRLGEPEEVSHMVCYLASKQADFVTGQTFYIDGGQSIWGDQWIVGDDVPKYPPYEG